MGNNKIETEKKNEYPWIAKYAIGFEAIINFYQKPYKPGSEIIKMLKTRDYG